MSRAGQTRGDRYVAREAAGAAVAAPPPPATRLETDTIRRSTAEKRSFAGELARIALDVAGSRDLLYQLTLRDIRVRYAQAAMGFAWAVFVPMLTVLSGMLVRFAMAQSSGADLHSGAIAGMAVKGLTWSFFAGAIGTATASLVANMGLLTKLYFPREVLPLSAVLAQTFDSLIAGAVLALLLPVLGFTVSPHLLWAAPLAALLFTLTLASALFLSCANLYFRDVKYIVQVLLTFGIFLTPVFFEPVMLGPTGGRLLMLNPLSPIMEGLRLAVVDGHDLLTPIVEMTGKGQPVQVWSPWYLAYAAAFALAGLLASLRIFRSAADTFAEYV